MDKLYSYKMSHDDRFAPNPCHGVLTLATCKPYLRLKAKAGDWIAGWTSISMKRHSTPIGQEKLVYLAKVTEKLSFKEYWNRYPEKRPGKDNESLTGDNIYSPDISESDGYRLIPNLRHSKSSQKNTDLRGKYVLVCEEFYYFGGTVNDTPLEVPIHGCIRPKVPKRQSPLGTITESPPAFIDFVCKNVEKCKYYNHIK